MNLVAPILSEGTEFRRMSVAESGGVYRFKLTRSAIFSFKDAILPVPQRLSFRTNGKEWLRIEPHRAIIARNYSWNGNSIKRGFRIFGRDVWLGTLDFDPGTLSASLIHDALFQYSGLHQLPFSLEEANNIYAACCHQNRFRLTFAYKAALDEFSAPFWGKREPNQSCHEI